LRVHPEDLQKTSHPTIYHRLLDPSIKGASAAPATAKSLKDEAQLMLIAGSDNIENTLSNGVFRIVEKPELYGKLMAELNEAWPVLKDSPSFQDLEKLPYLVRRPWEAAETNRFRLC
jgi:cytochrome P450